MSIMKYFLNTTATIWIPDIDQDGTNEVDANGQPIAGQTRVVCNARIRKRIKKIFRPDGTVITSVREYIIDVDPQAKKGDSFIADGTVVSSTPTTEAFKIELVDPYEDFDTTSEWEVIV